MELVQNPFETDRIPFRLCRQQVEAGRNCHVGVSCGCHGGSSSLSGRACVSKSFAAAPAPGHGQTVALHVCRVLGVDGVRPAWVKEGVGRCGGMVDAGDSKSPDGNIVRVRVSPPAPPFLAILIARAPGLGANGALQCQRVFGAFLPNRPYRPIPARTAVSMAPPPCDWFRFGDKRRAPARHGPGPDPAFGTVGKLFPNRGQRLGAALKML